MELLLGHMRSECFADVVRSNDGDDSSDDLSPSERAYYENLEPNNALLTGEIENVDDGIDYRFRGGEGVRQKACGPQESNSGFDDKEGEVIDDRSNQQLWQRLKNDVEQDLSLELRPLPSYRQSQAMDSRKECAAFWMLALPLLHHHGSRGGPEPSQCAPAA